jgi:hypothetical protein
MERNTRNKNNKMDEVILHIGCIKHGQAAYNKHYIRR